MNDVESIFSALLKTKYPKQYLPRICSYLQSLKLKNFKTINDYCLNIKEVIKRTKIHNSYTKAEIGRKFDRDFMNRLPNELILKYSELGIYDAETIIKRTSDTEKLLQTFDTLSEHKTINTKIGYEIKSEQKLCKVHRSRTHNDKVCISQRTSRAKNEIKDRNNEVNNITRYILPYLFIGINSSNHLKILLDSGANIS
ncbi:hypothetical protein DMUE_5541, partial [Dictyocoela muelleri]